MMHERLICMDFTEARDSEWQWHPLDLMQACTSLQTDNHAYTWPGALGVQLLLLLLRIWEMLNFRCGHSILSSAIRYKYSCRRFVCAGHASEPR